MEAMKADRLVIEQLYAQPEHTAAYATVQEFIRPYTEPREEYGMRGLDVMLPAVPVERYLIPVLHIMLGVGKRILDDIMLFGAERLEDATLLPARPVHDAIQLMLRTHYTVISYKLNSNSLIGNDMHCMLTNYAVICARISVIFKNRDLRTADCTTTDEEIDIFLGKMSDLMAVFYAIYSLMSQTTQLTAQEQNIFELMCKNYGTMWRRYFPGCNIPPKMHVLESHAWQMMRKWGCLGDKTEAAVERLHKENNGYGRRLCAIHARPQAQMVMVKLKDQANLPEIQAIQAQVKAATSRFTSAATKLRKRILKDEAVHAKEMMIAQAVEIVNAFRTAHHVV
jgi:hypothetical protein